MPLNNFDILVDSHDSLQPQSTTENKSTKKSSDNFNVSYNLSPKNSNISEIIMGANRDVEALQNDFDAIQKHENFLNKMQNIRNEISQEISISHDYIVETINMTDFKELSNDSMQSLEKNESNISSIQEITQGDKKKIEFLEKHSLDEIPLVDFKTEYENATPFLNPGQAFESIEQAQIFLGKMESSNIDETHLTKEYKNILSKNYFKAFDMMLGVTKADPNQKFYAVSNDVQVVSKILGEILKQTIEDNRAIQENIIVFDDIRKKFQKLFNSRITEDRENILKEVDALLEKIDSEVIKDFLDGHDIHDKYKDLFLQLKEGTFISNTIDQIHEDKKENNDSILQELKESTLTRLSQQKNEKSDNNYEKDSSGFSKQIVLERTGSLMETQSHNITQSQVIRLIH